VDQAFSAQVKPRRQLLSAKEGVRAPTSPAVWPTVAHFAAMDVEGLTLGLSWITAFMSSNAPPMPAIQGFTRMQRRPYWYLQQVEDEAAGFPEVKESCYHQLQQL
jgi:hypothetical protein